MSQIETQCILVICNSTNQSISASKTSRGGAKFEGLE